MKILRELKMAENDYNDCLLDIDKILADWFMKSDDSDATGIVSL